MTAICYERVATLLFLIKFSYGLIFTCFIYPENNLFQFPIFTFIAGNKTTHLGKIQYKNTYGGGKIKLNILASPSPAMIRIGFHKVYVCDPKDSNVLTINGLLVFNGTAHIGNGSKIYVAKGAELVLGNNFAISASSQINCYKKIVFGKDIQFSWDCLTMDSDTHHIYNEQGVKINESREIVFGNKIWIGCRTTILKGSVIPNNCVIGAYSLVSGKNFENNSIIVGNPAKSIKKISKWEL